MLSVQMFLIVVGVFLIGFACGIYFAHSNAKQPDQPPPPPTMRRR